MLVRHGQVAGAAGAFPAPGARLTAEGRAAVSDLAAALVEADVRPAALWTSDLPRAVESAEVLGAALGVTPRLEPRLREADPGAWSGRTSADLAAERPREVSAWLANLAGYAPPAGESLAQAAGRVREAMAAILEAPVGEGPRLVVTHSWAVRVVLADALGLSLPRALAIGIEPASLTRLDRYDDGVWAVGRVGWRPCL